MTTDWTKATLTLRRPDYATFRVEGLQKGPYGLHHDQTGDRHAWALSWIPIGFYIASARDGEALLWLADHLDPALWSQPAEQADIDAMRQDLLLYADLEGIQIRPTARTSVGQPLLDFLLSGD